MRRSLTAFFLIALATVFSAVASHAQSSDFTRWNFNFGGGFTPTLGQTNNSLHTGWNATGGGGYNFTRNFGLEFDTLYASLGVNSSVIQEFQVPGANSHIWGFNLNPIVRFRTSHRLGFYVLGGPGYYHRVVNFTQPTTSVVDLFDPFFGYLTPTPITTNQTIGTILKVGWGADAGAGFTYKLGSGGTRFFTEVRYHYISTQARATEIIPVTFGIRW